MSDAKKFQINYWNGEKYVTLHPETTAEQVIQTPSNRMVTDEQITTFQSKQDNLGFTPENVSNKNIANGYVGLDGTGKINVDMLPSGIDATTIGGKTVNDNAEDENSLWTANKIKNLIDIISSGIGSSIHAPVLDIAAAKAIPSNERIDKMLVNVENTGLYRWDTESTDTPNDSSVLQPLDIEGVAAGRWIKMSAQINSHELLDNIQGGTTNEHYHLTQEELQKVQSYEQYQHPSGDGYLHVPATGTTNEGKVLMAGATEGSVEWKDIPSGGGGVPIEVTEGEPTSNIGICFKIIP